MTRSPPEPGSFAEMELDPRLLQALETLGFHRPTPIQAGVIPHLLGGRDVIGRARTGSGKTAAYGLPILHGLEPGSHGVKALVLCPTRELALQVSGALRGFAAMMTVRFATIYGGAPYPPQIQALKNGASIAVGTPGRLLDHLDRGNLDLSGLQTFVLDEADEMLRMGFLDDVKRLLDATPRDRQVALFSATMPEPIRKVAMRLSDPVEIQVEDRALSVGHIQQYWIAVPERHKLDALVRVLRAVGTGTTLVFARTRVSCAETADALARRGLAVDALHGDLHQPARERVLQRLRARQLSTVIATDVASRGIDVDHISHIVNFDLPPEVESYVHRIGRTSRADHRGTAISFCLPREMQRLKQIQRATGCRIHRMEVPSDADIARSGRKRLVEELAGALDDQHPSGQAVEEIKQLKGWTEQQVAQAALALLARRDGVELGAVVDEAPPQWARSQHRREKDFRNINQVELFIPMGRKRNLTPAEVVGALTNEGGLSGRDLGRITITPRKTFVGMSRAALDSLLLRAQSLHVAGRDVPISRAQPQVQPRRPAPPPRSNRAPPRPRAPGAGRGPLLRRPHRGKKR